jgi:hypothetical protein
MFDKIIETNIIIVIICTRCGDMFENGSYLRRRKRFKLMKKAHEDKSTPTSKTNAKLLPSTSTATTLPVKLQPVKSSFLIDNLLANDTNTNTSFTNSSSSPASEINSPLQHLVYTTDFDLVRKLTCFSDINGQQQQLYW